MISSTTNKRHWAKRFGYQQGRLVQCSLRQNPRFEHEWDIYSLQTLGVECKFLAQTGQPITYPVGQYLFMGAQIPNYGKRNGQRLPFYHRLDIAATLTPKKNATRKARGSWVFGVYNVYNRRNAATISFKQDSETGKNQAYRLSIFGIIPSVTYNIQF